MIYEKSVFHIVRWVCFSVPVCVWGSVTVRSRYGLIHHRRVTALGSSKKKKVTSSIYLPARFSSVQPNLLFAASALQTAYRFLHDCLPDARSSQKLVSIYVDLFNCLFNVFVESFMRLALEMQSGSASPYSTCFRTRTVTFRQYVYIHT